MLKWRTLLAEAYCLLGFLAYGQTPEQRIETLRKTAALIQQGDLTGAENVLKPLLSRTPDDAVVLNLLGVIRMRQNQPEEAASLFRKAIQSGHKIAGPHINLAALYGRDRPFEAIAELREALAIAPGDQQAVGVLRQIAKDAALSAMKSGDNARAASILEKSREALPHDPELLYHSGLIAFESKAYQEADRDLKEALKFRPEYPEATYALARTYLAESLAKPAEDEMCKYLLAKPDDATAQYGLGYILMAEQRIDEAKAAFQKSLALQPNQTESVFQLGEIAMQQGQNELAREDFDKVLARDAHHGGALTEIGILAYRAAKYDEAKADLERAIEASPGYQKAHYYYALTLSRLGQKEAAEREFSIAKSLQPEHGGEHHLPAAQP